MNLGLLGAIGGAGKGMADVGEMMAEDRRAERKRLDEVELMKMRDELETGRFKTQRNLQRQWREEDAGLVSSRASEIANEERGLLLSNAEDIYRKSGMSQEDISAGLGAVDAARQEKATPTTEQRLRAARETGILGEKEAIGVELQLAKDERDDKRLEQQAARDALRTALQERRLDLDARKIDAMIARMGGSSANVSAFVQNFDKIKKETGWGSDQVLDYLNAAKQRGEEWSQTVETDPEDPTRTTIKTTRKGTGTPPRAGNDPLGIRK